VDHGSSKLWRTLLATLGKDKTVHDRPATDFDADGFANYFSEKVSGIRVATEGVGPPATGHSPPHSPI